MIAREHHRRKQRPALPHDVIFARAHLRALGWSYRSAAPRLGVSYQHVAAVLTGRRTSRALLARIAALPPRPSDD